MVLSIRAVVALPSRAARALGACRRARRACAGLHHQPSPAVRPPRPDERRQRIEAYRPGPRAAAQVEDVGVGKVGGRTTSRAAESTPPRARPRRGCCEPACTWKPAKRPVRATARAAPRRPRARCRTCSPRCRSPWDGCAVEARVDAHQGSACPSAAIGRARPESALAVEADEVRARALAAERGAPAPPRSAPSNRAARGARAARVASPTDRLDSDVQVGEVGEDGAVRLEGESAEGGAEARDLGRDGVQVVDVQRRAEALAASAVRSALRRASAARSVP